MLKRKIPISVALPLVLAIIAAGVLIDNRIATATTETKPTCWRGEDCLKCHTDPVTLKKMQDKAGDPTFCQASYDRLTHAKNPITQPKWDSKKKY